MAKRSAPVSGGVPRAVIHKQILDAAAEHPDATMAAVADEVDGASTELVEKVLAEYGDPADDDGRQAPSGDAEGTLGDEADGDEATEEDDDAGERAEGDDRDLRERLSAAQVETLRAVRERPDATQAEVAAALGVSRATVSNRINGIDGFDWESRGDLVARVFEDSPASPGDADVSSIRDDGPESAAPVGVSEADGPGDVATGESAGGRSSDGGGREPGSDGDLRARVDRLESRLDGIEAAVSRGDREGPAVVIDDPELAHKAVRAILLSDELSEAEERRLLAAIL